MKSKGVDDQSTRALVSCPFLDEPVDFFGAIRVEFGETVFGEGFLRVESVWKKFCRRLREF